MTEHGNEPDLEPLRGTIDRTAESARKAARNSAQILTLMGAKKGKASPVSTLVLKAAKNSTEILRLMKAGQDEPDPISILADMLFLMSERLEAMDGKLDRILSGMPPAPLSDD